MSDVQTLILDLFRRAGYSDDQVDVSAVTGYVSGLVIADRSNYRAVIEGLQALFQIDSVERNGKVVFLFRGQEAVLSLAESDLVGINDGGRQEQNSYAITVQPLQDLPQRIDVVYNDIAIDYQQNIQQGIRQPAPNTNVATVNTGLVLNSSTAKQAADRLLDTAWAERYGFSFVLSNKYYAIEPGDVLTVNLAGRDWDVRVVRVKLQNNTAEIEAISTDADSYRQVNAGSQHGGVVVIVIAEPTLLYMLDLPLIENEFDPPRYFAAGGAVAGDLKWRFSTLFQSYDDTSFGAVLTFGQRVTHGEALTILPKAQTVYFDEGNTVDVQLLDGELASTTSAGAFNAVNSALLGNELIIFKTATLIAANTYRLSGLLRARRGTEQHIATHQIAERFILLGDPVLSKDIAPEIVGQDLFFRAVSNGLTLSNTVSETLTPTAANLKPFSPVKLSAVFEGNDDIELTWIRRTRYNANWNNGGDVPLSESTESYTIEIMNGINVVRTISSVATSYTYTAAEQVVDFSAAVDILEVKVYQVSASVGLGFAAHKTFYKDLMSYFNTIRLWLDADDAATFTINSGVEQWRDKSGNDYHANQSTSGNRPVRQSNVIGVRSGVKFDGIDDFLDLGTSEFGDAGLYAGGSQPWMIFIVARTATTGSGTIIARTNEEYYPNRMFHLFEDIDPPDESTELALYKGAFDWRDGLTHLYCLAWDGTNALFYPDAMPDVEVLVGNSAEEIAVNTSLGARLVAGSPFFAYDGHIFEVMIFDEILPNNERILLEGILAHKWQFVDRLSPSHRWKNVVPINPFAIQEIA